MSNFKQFGLTDIRRILYSMTTNTYPFQAHIKHSPRYHILGYETSLNKSEKTEIIQIIFFENNKIRNLPWKQISENK